MLPYGSLLSNITDQLLLKKLRTLIGAFDQEAISFCERLGIKSAYLRITRPCRVLVLIDGGSQWNEQAGQLMRVESSNIHLVFSDRDLIPGNAEVWVLFSYHKESYNAALAFASAKRASRHRQWRPFQDPFAATINARALDFWEETTDLNDLARIV